MPDHFFSEIFAGSLTGFLVGLTGMGGGAIMTPLLILFLGQAPSVAVATDLWFALITKIIAIGYRAKNHEIQWHAVGALCSGSLPVTLFILYNIHLTPSSYLLPALEYAIALCLLSTACMLNIRIHPRRIALSSSLSWLLGMGIGALIGLCVTLTSIGAGTLGTAFLYWLSPYQLSLRQIIGTELAHAVPLAFLAGLGYLWMNQVDYLLLSHLLCGSIPFVILGTFCSQYFSTIRLQKILGLLLGLSGVYLLIH